MFLDILRKTYPGFKDLPQDRKLILLGALFNYLFKGVNVNDYNFWLKTTYPDLPKKDFMYALLRDGATLKNCKLYVYAFYCLRGKLTSDFGLPEDTRKLLAWLVVNDKALASTLRRFKIQGFQPFSLEKFDSLLAATSVNLDTYISKVVYKKLSFLIKSYGFTANDLKQDIQSWILYAIYRAYPAFESDLHFENIGKSAVTNRSLNIIAEQTAASRSALFDKSSEAKTISIEAMGFSSSINPNFSFESPDALISYSHTVSGLGGASYSVEDIDTQLSIAKLTTGMNYTQRQFIDLLRGDFHPVFSEHLGQANDELYETMPRKEYIKECSKFLGMELSETRQFLKELQAQLS